MALRPNTMPPSTSMTTAVETLGSCHSKKLSFGQASTSRPSMTRATNAAPQLTQKCPTTRTRLRLRGGCVLLLLGRSLHIRDAHLVAAALLGGIERLVRPFHQRREQGRFIGGGDTDEPALFTTLMERADQALY